MTKEDLNFRYRHSEIQELHCIVLQATFALEKGNHAEIKAQMDELTELRELKQPQSIPLVAVSLNALLVILQEINPRRWLTRLKMGRCSNFRKACGIYC